MTQKTAANPLPSEPSGPPPGQSDLAEIATAWLDHLRHVDGASDLTVSAYERDLRQFATHLHRTLKRTPTLGDIASVDVRTFRGFLAARRRDGTTSRSLARTMSALRSFYRWLENTGELKNRTILSMTLPRLPHGVPKPLTVDKAAELIDDVAAPKGDWVAARDAAAHVGSAAVFHLRSERISHCPLQAGHGVLRQ